MRSKIPIVLCLIFLGLISMIHQPDLDYILFKYPENPHYGYVRPKSQSVKNGKLFYLVRFPDSTKTYNILDTVLALGYPKMCDTNAVSFTQEKDADSSC